MIAAWDWSFIAMSIAKPMVMLSAIKTDAPRIFI
jgi:hypothetical protein